MGVIHRRHIRLVQADMQGINVEERQGLRSPVATVGNSEFYA